VGSDTQITAIGDPNQAIYGFRGSDVGFFESFKDDFSGAKILSLSDNYRSSQNLLSASSQVMASARAAHVPQLVAKIYSRGKLIIKECPTDRAEAEYVVHNIEKMIGGTSMFSQDSGRVDTDEEAEVSFSDIAVLYRLKSQAYLLEEAFDRSGIPYHISGTTSKKNEDEICPTRGEDVTFEGEKVSLMTIHSAKGLEFSVVFIVGCEESILPLDLEGLTSEVDEERRLFYVGMTRAKTGLFLTKAKKTNALWKNIQ